MSCQVMYQSYYPYFPYPHHHHPPHQHPVVPSTAGSSTAATTTSPRILHDEASSPVSPDRHKTSHSSPSLMSSSSLIRDHSSESSNPQEPASSSPYGISEPYHHHILPEISRRGSSRSPSPRRKLEDHPHLPSNNVIKDSSSSPSLQVQDESLEEEEEDKNTQGTAQYLTANCVVYTSYIGDPSRMVDEHFTRALSAPSEKSKTLPLSQRNLPPSFWNSDYQYPLSSLGHFHAGSSSVSGSVAGGGIGISASDSYSHDPYTNPAFLGAANDSWQNYMSSYHHHHHHAAAASHAASRGMHDMYSASRLNPQYSSLLLQSTVSNSGSSSNSSSSPSGRSSRKLVDSSSISAGSVSAPASWTSPQNQHLIVDNYNTPHHHHYNTAAAAAAMGLDGNSMQSSTSKDLYWF
ncbi:uncharacterized protein [Lepeophtheirus salmonis]|uniref:Protein vestigiallike [Musca domestica] n=1 Tax=Lepeophtheirus salmonis TaxID=72036 RepID=A0A0K2TMC7_LEPSM|nr:transcription cofactor vestigial-like protein 2 isoform X1 [Lepeophtheirus salmonis]